MSVDLSFTYLDSEGNEREYEIAGYRLEGGDWRDVEEGAPLPTPKQWGEIDLMTLNLRPDTDDGFYRTAHIFQGFDYPFEEHKYNPDDLADQMAEDYGEYL